jgi:hypothetical protein
MSSAPFDPVAYKRTTHRAMAGGGRTVASLGPGARSLAGRGHRDDARHGRRRAERPGARRYRRRRGPEARVSPARRARRPCPATDISSNILAYAERSARDAGLHHVETRVVDGEQLDVPPGTFDAVISRVGFIYFPDQHAAFVGVRRAPFRARVLRGPAPDARGAGRPDREAAWSEIERELFRYETASGFEGPCECSSPPGPLPSAPRTTCNPARRRLVSGRSRPAPEGHPVARRLFRAA